MREQLFAAESVTSRQDDSYRAEMIACNQRLASITSREASAEQQVLFLRTELSMFEATALGRNDEVAEMQSRLSQSQKQMAKASLHMAASFQQAVEQHLLQLSQN